MKVYYENETSLDSLKDKKIAILGYVSQGHAHESILVPSIHPSQLYSALGGAIILILLLLLDRSKRPTGFTFANFLLLYGIHRFVIDQFRYYEEVMRVLGLSVNQWLSVGFVIAGILLHRRLRSRAAPA